jgi:N6-L-threonylcarbamoyladenine synthase
MIILALETSCDETSAAVVRDGRILSNLIASQVSLHAEYGGVVPELAAREHLRNLIPVTQAALQSANIRPEQLDAVAATQGPGLPTALLVGFKAAQAVAFALQKPFLGIHHHEAHLYSPWISGQPPVADFSGFQPNVSLIVSGGHTLLVRVEAELKHSVLGSTMDDAAGECFDKAGKLMGLPYPAGPEIDRLAEHGNPKAFDFPRPLLTDAGDDFSFSGLKTSVRYFLRDHPDVLNDAQQVRDLCASIQAAIVEVLVVKTLRAAKPHPVA